MTIARRTIFVMLAIGAVLSILLAMWFLQSSMSEPRCSERLRIIGQALFLYSSHNNQYPPDLETLAKINRFTGNITQCPQGGKYVFIARNLLTTDIGPKDIVVYDSGTHGMGGNVLLGNGAVVFLEQAEFQRVYENAKTSTTLPSLPWVP